MVFLLLTPTQKLVYSLVLSKSCYSVMVIIRVRVRVKVGFTISFKVGVKVIFSLRQIPYH